MRALCRADRRARPGCRAQRRLAHGAIIAFTDDDRIPDPGWLRAGASAFTAGVAGAEGQIVVPLPARPTDDERDAAGLAGAAFATANCFYWRDALAAVGGFDERFSAAWREDSDLFFTLLERGYQLMRAPGALVGAGRGRWRGLLGGALWALLTGRFCARRLRHVAELLVTSALIPPLATFWRVWGAIRFRVWLL